MPKSHGSQRRAAKHRKRRQARQRARAARQQLRPRERAPLTATGTAPSAHAGGHDPHCAPAPEAWLALDEYERLRAVATYHERTGRAAQRPPNMTTHASLHVVVETQLAANEPAAARVALQRLMSDGLSRHDAVHAIGWIAIAHLKRAVDERRPVDDAAYEEALARLTRASWLAAAGVEPVVKSLSAKRGSD